MGVLLLHASFEARTETIALSLTLTRSETGAPTWVVRAYSRKLPTVIIIRTFKAASAALGFAAEVLSRGIEPTLGHGVHP